MLRHESFKTQGGIVDTLFRTWDGCLFALLGLMLSYNSVRGVMSPGGRNHGERRSAYLKPSAGNNLSKVLHCLETIYSITLSIFSSEMPGKRSEPGLKFSAARLPPCRFLCVRVGSHSIKLQKPKFPGDLLFAVWWNPCEVEGCVVYFKNDFLARFFLSRKQPISRQEREQIKLQIISEPKKIRFINGGVLLLFFPFFYRLWHKHQRNRIQHICLHFYSKEIQHVW